MDIKRLAWKTFSIHKDEFNFVLPLFIIYFLSGSFFAIGQIFSETIFLKTYGAKGFSGFFIQNGIAIIIAGVFYNFFILKLSLRKGYIFLLSLITVLIISASYFKDKDFAWMPFYIYMGNYIFTVFLDIHFFNYAFQNLTIRNSKRILPFLMGGGKLGGIISGLLIFYIFSKDISRFGMIVWAVNGALILIPVLFFKISGLTGNEKSGPDPHNLLPDLTFFDKLFRNIKSSLSSSFLIYAVLTAFLVSVVNQLSEYYFAMIFNVAFTTKNELSAFLSLYTLCADFITLVFQLFIISKIINSIGVRKANFVYPAAFLSLIAACMVMPNLVLGILLRFFRKNISAIIRTPVYNIILAASPRDRLAGVKSFISGIVNPMGMIAGGFAILFIYKRLTAMEGFVFSAGLGIILIVITYLQNRAYVRTLADRIKFDSHIQDDETDVGIDNYSELLDKDKSARNLSLIEALFNNQPSLELAPVLIASYEKLANDTKENLLNLIRTGRSETDFLLISKALSDPDYGIRSVALSVVSGYDQSFRKKVLMQNYSDMLTGEQYAVSILLGTDENNNEISLDDYAIEKLARIAKGVMYDEVKPVEFIMLVQALPWQYFLNSLYELVIKKRDIDLLKCIIPLADKLTRRRIIKILYIFRNERMDYLARFMMLAGNGQETDFAMILDFREVSLNYMNKIFHYDDKTAGILFRKLFKNISYNKKSNYLKYFISQNVVNEKELEQFIEFEINRIKDIYELRVYLKKKYHADSGAGYIIKFLEFILIDVVELKKHLILKAVSILNGFKIDEVYESNILFHDKDLNNFILEYIESSVKQTREVISIFEGKQISLHKHKSGITDAEFIKNYKYLAYFLPDISPLLKFTFSEILNESEELKKSDPSIISKEADMFSLIEKIVFLKENTLFSELNINEIIHIAKIAREIEYMPDNNVIKQGEKGDTLFIIISGEVKVFSRNKVLAVLGPGNCIGELSIIDEEPRSADVVTTQKSRVLSIKRKDFLLTLKDNPAISINIMQVMAGRLRKLI